MALLKLNNLEMTYGKGDTMVHALRNINLEIDEKANRYPTELSGGQCQRAAIARAIITNPEVILADEPTGALDEENGKNILNIFKALNEKGTTIVLVTHDMEIADMCKRKICLRDGRIV